MGLLNKINAAKAAAANYSGITPTNSKKVEDNRKKVEDNRKKVEDNRKKVLANAINAAVEKGKPNTIVKKGNVTSSYDSKGNLSGKYAGKKDNNIHNTVTVSPKSEYSSKSGTLKRYTRDPKTGNNIGTSIDTTGYSSGKKSFNVISSESTSKGTIPSKYKVKSISSKDVPMQLKKMQKMK